LTRTISFEMDPFFGRSARLLAVGARIPGGWLDQLPVERCDAADAVAALHRHAPDCLLLDGAAVSGALVDAMAAPGLSAMAVVVMADDDGPTVDAIGTLLDGRIDLFLNRATPAAEARAALSGLLAAMGGHVVADGSLLHTDGGQRLEALRQDAERVARALAELAAGGETAGAAPARPLSAMRIRAHIKARRLRERFLSADLFADPAWDMLLDLTAARLEGRQVSVSSLCIAAAVPTTTALRWIKLLIDRGMVDRMSDPSDARRAFIALAPATAAAMELCTEAVLNLPGQ